MGPKSVIYICMFIFGTAGGWIPTLWGADAFGMASILGSMIGGGFGIWLGYKIGKAVSG
jgi:hypothetical protein